MANKQITDWLPPVSFYFRMNFQRGKEHFKASFMEVSGLNIQLTVKERTDDNNARIKLPTSLSHGNITFKRPVAALSEPFTEWMNAVSAIGKVRTET